MQVLSGPKSWCEKSEELAMATSRQHESTSNAASIEGFYDGQDTGVFDAETKASLKAYQKSASQSQWVLHR